MQELSPYPTLKRSPLQEALLDVRVDLEQRIDVEIFASLPRKFSNVFPAGRQKRSVSGTFGLAGEKTLVTAEEPVILGYLHESEDKNQVLQMQKEGFSLHQLNGYSGWDLFSKNAMDLWEYYDPLTGKKTLRRLGLRYVNKVELQTPFLSDEYFHIMVGMPQSLAKYHFGSRSVIQFSLIDDRRSLFANISLSYFPSQTKEDHLEVIFDIDVGKSSNLGLETMWADFATMRSFNDEVFFTTITEKMLSLIS